MVLNPHSPQRSHDPSTSNSRTPTWFTKEVHVFCDASQYVYAAVAYLKITDKTGSFKTSIVMGKSWVAPQATIPRLELSAAVIGTRMYQKIIDELLINFPLLTLHRIFGLILCLCFVTFRIQDRSSRYLSLIDSKSFMTRHTDRWLNVPTKLNPADAASRGIMPNETDKINTFLNWPDFLSNETYLLRQAVVYFGEIE